MKTKTFVAVFFDFSEGSKGKYHSHHVGVIDDRHDAEYWHFMFNTKNSRLNNPKNRSGVKSVHTLMRTTVINNISDIDIEKFKVVSYNYWYRNFHRVHL